MPARIKRGTDFPDSHNNYDTFAAHHTPSSIQICKRTFFVILGIAGIWAKLNSLGGELGVYSCELVSLCVQETRSLALHYGWRPRLWAQFKLQNQSPCLFGRKVCLTERYIKCQRQISLITGFVRLLMA